MRSQRGLWERGKETPKIETSKLTELAKISTPAQPQLKVT